LKESIMTTEAEELAALIKRSKIPADALAKGLASDQSTFEAIAEPADGLAFVTRLTDSPLQVTGRLGFDGVWRLVSCIVSGDGHELAAEVTAAKAVDEMLVLVDGIAERMVKFIIPRFLAEEAMPEGVREAFMRRLAASRFGSTIH
jgi:hypothetical protein